MITRSRHQRSIAGILGFALLAYALLLPIADAKLIGMGHDGMPVGTAEAPCHMAGDDMAPPHDRQSAPCCQVDRCYCVMLSATVALPGTTLSRLIPVHAPVQSFVKSLHPSTLVELPLRPPDA
ncbi:MAG TPA: hypothetical protein VIT67_05295 [Povalibacter sp.]